MRNGMQRRGEAFLWDFYAVARLILFVAAMALIGLTGAGWVSLLYLAAGLFCLPGVWIKLLLRRIRVKEWVALLLALILILAGIVLHPPFPAPETAVVPEAGEEEHSLLSGIPAYRGEAYVTVNGNEPFFDKSELGAASFERYGELDALGRCTACVACVGKDLMPTEPRGSIYEVKPTGWHSIRFDFIDGESLYNRCHLIAFQLTGENANRNNLITGTRYLNTQGMLPFEIMAGDYVRDTGNHVLYRVTPLFEGNELVARGVLMEAKSVEDNGEGVCFCVFCYNVQPDVYIDYATGDASLIWEEAG